MKQVPAVSPGESALPIRPSPLLDPQSAGIYLGGTEKPLTPASLADWRTKRIGPPWVKIGKLVRYLQTDLDAWIASRTTGPEGSR